MSRNANRSRIAPVAPRAKRRRARGRDFDADLRVRRGNPQLQVPNPVAPAIGWYAYLARKDGSANGPWRCTFECTNKTWLNQKIYPQFGGMGHYHHDRIRQVLNGRTYEAAWSSGVGGIATRNGLRHIYNKWAECLVDAGDPAVLGIYEKRLWPDDLEDIQDPDGGAGHPLRVGGWYALELRRWPGNPPLDWDDGIFHEEDPATSEFEEPHNHLMVRFANLRRLPRAPQAAVFAPWHSQALIRSLHYLRKE